MSEINIEEGKNLLLERYSKCTPEEITHGRHWYMKAHDFAQELSVNFGSSLRQSAGVIACLSPRNKWADNKEDALTIIQEWGTGGFYKEQKPSSPYANMEKAIKVLEDDVDPDEILVQKSRSFYRCIYYPLTKEVCVDVWAARALNFKERWIPRKVYPQLQKCYELAAKELDILPHVLQATIWVNIRGKPD